MILTTLEDRAKLDGLVRRYVQIEAEVAAAREDQKAIVEQAKTQLHVPPKALKQAAKELVMDGTERAAQRELEDALDACRVALGLLADTPLGEAAQKVADGVREGTLDVKIGRGPWLSETLGNGAAEPKKRGRPKGSRNKPKRSEYTEELASVADTPPPVPDVPEAPMDPVTAGRDEPSDEELVRGEW